MEVVVWKEKHTEEVHKLPSNEEMPLPGRASMSDPCHPKEHQKFGT